MHAQIACEKCHKVGQPFAGLPFDKCRACHQDYHQGAFAARAGGADCEGCHGVAGFSPALYTLEQHQKSRYPLQGAHLAVPCGGCHLKDKTGGEKRYQFDFKATTCESCHGDPHSGVLSKIPNAGNCESCHNVDTWQQLSFDHNKTKFPLSGKHAQTLCRNCHAVDPAQFDPAAMKFTQIGYACADCHQDVHRGQFRSTTSVAATDCSRCHQTSKWQELNFDHNRDSAYKLTGAHLKVPCVGCHKAESEELVTFIRYRPLGTDCQSCHDVEQLRDKSQP
jgi:hypothetical protein